MHTGDLIYGKDATNRTMSAATSGRHGRKVNMLQVTTDDNCCYSWSRTCAPCLGGMHYGNQQLVGLILVNAALITGVERVHISGLGFSGVSGRMAED